MKFEMIDSNFLEMNCYCYIVMYSIIAYVCKCVYAYTNIDGSCLKKIKT
jgi:hypothetical protein